MTYEEPLRKGDHVCVSLGNSLFVSTVSQRISSIIIGRQITLPIERSYLGLAGTLTWKSRFEHKSVNEMWKCITQTIGTYVTEHVSLHSQESHSKTLSWIFKTTKVAIEKRNEAWASYSKK